MAEDGGKSLNSAGHAYLTAPGDGSSKVARSLLEQSSSDTWVVSPVIWSPSQILPVFSEPPNAL